MRTVLAALLCLLVAGAPLAAADEATAPALIIVDIQQFYFPGGALPLEAPEAASARAAELLARFRAEGWPVVHVGHNASQGKDFHPDVAPRDGEVVVFKDEVNAFHGTNLQETLAGLGVQRVVVCGMQTHMCLEAAARAAHDLGYRVTVVGDACATRDLKHGERTVPAADVHAATLATLAGVYARVLDTEAFLAQP
jgi:nicotinamidase-related amidase